MVFPSDEIAQVRRALSPMKPVFTIPVSISHTFSVPSLDADITYLPSYASDTAVTGPV